MKKKKLAGLAVIGILTVSMVGGVAGASWFGLIQAENYEQLADEVCQLQIGLFMAPFCVPELESEITFTDPENVQLEVYAEASTIQDLREQLKIEQRSHLNQSYGMAMAKAKLTIIQELNNGSSMTEAQTTALNIVQDYYSAQKARVLNYQERSIINFMDLYQKINVTDGLTYDEVIHYEADLSDDTGDKQQCTVYDDHLDTEEVTVTLYNGSKNNYTALYSSIGNFNDVCYIVYPANDEPNTYFDENDGYDAINVSSGYGDSVIAIDGRTSHKTLELIDNYYENAVATIIDMNERIYENYDKGDLSASEVLGPLEMLITASTNYRTTGGTSYLVLSLQQAGLASNGSMSFQVQWTNKNQSTKTDWGQLFVAKPAYNGTLKVDKKYSAEGEAVTLVHVNDAGKAVKTDINGNFTILEMRNARTGESYNSTGLQVTTFYTSGTEDLEAQLAEVEERQDYIVSSGGGFGGGGVDVGGFFSGILEWFSSLIPDISKKVVVTLVAVVGIILILAAGR